MIFRTLPHRSGCDYTSSFNLPLAAGRSRGNTIDRQSGFQRRPYPGLSMSAILTTATP
jgi:hypothetical protein